MLLAPFAGWPHTGTPSAAAFLQALKLPLGAVRNYVLQVG